MRTPIHALLGLLLLGVPATAGAQLSAYAGLTGAGASTRAPYTGVCDDRAAMLGIGAHAGVRRGMLSLEARYASLRQPGDEPCAFVVDPFVAEAGVFRVEGYRRERDRTLRVASLRAGFVPPVLPLATLYGGAGWETQQRDPLLLAGLSLRSGGRLGIVAGVEVMQLRASYHVSEREWRDWRVVRETTLSEEGRWRRATSAWLGAELRLSRAPR